MRIPPLLFLLLLGDGANVVYDGAFVVILYADCQLILSCSWLWEEVGDK
jgi:hypothetical protein